MHSEEKIHCLEFEEKFVRKRAVVRSEGKKPNMSKNNKKICIRPDRILQCGGGSSSTAVRNGGTPVGLRAGGRGRPASASPARGSGGRLSLLAPPRCGHCPGPEEVPRPLERVCASPSRPSVSDSGTTEHCDRVSSDSSVLWHI